MTLQNEPGELSKSTGFAPYYWPGLTSANFLNTSENFITSTMSKTDFVSAIKDAELGEGKMRGVRVKGKPVLLAKVGGQVYAVSNLCPHAGCQLQSGILTDYLVMCPCHGWKFDIRNGEYQENHQTKLQTYKCQIEKGKILIEISKNK